ncbi:MAG: hypothetical protein V3R64_05510, partial [Sphingomonadales bacterium]
MIGVLEMGKGFYPSEFEFKLAGQKFNEGSLEEAWIYLERSCEKGFQPALFQKAMLLAMGQTVKSDVQRAVNILYKLASGGYPEAMRSLANLYSNGLVVEDNWDLAKEWFLKAFLKGHVSSILEASILLKVLGK